MSLPPWTERGRLRGTPDEGTDRPDPQHRRHLRDQPLPVHRPERVADVPAQSLQLHPGGGAGVEPRPLVM